MSSSKEQKLKHSIYSTARKISREVGVNLNMEFESRALDLIAELTWKKLVLYGSDLEAFQKYCMTVDENVYIIKTRNFRHAKRSTITSDDVKLLVRRNDSLVMKELMETKLQTIQSNKPQTDPNPPKKKRT